MNPLTNKYILYIGLDYYRLPKEICKELRAMGAKVDFFPIKKKNFLVTILNRLCISLFNHIQNKYHLNIINSIKDRNYDFVFFIHVHQLSHKIIQKYREQFSQARFILYYWDSVTQHNYLPYIKYFDKVLSFDPIDSKKYSTINYLPLFFTRDFYNLPVDNKDMVANKILFIGTYNQLQRYEYVRLISDYLKKSNIRFDFNLDMKWTRYIRVIFENGKILNWKYLKFGKTSFDKYLALFSSHYYIVDFPNNIQSGLTMRVMETLGSGRKLITTNRNIKFEEFYDPKTILVIDNNNLWEINEFVNRGVSPEDRNPVEKYFLPNWLISVFQ